MQRNTTKKPPIGVMPKYLHDEKRLKELSIAIRRYALAGKFIPLEWVYEHNQLIEETKNPSDKN